VFQRHSSISLASSKRGARNKPKRPQSRTEHQKYVGMERLMPHGKERGMDFWVPPKAKSHKNNVTERSGQF